MTSQETQSIAAVPVVETGNKHISYGYLFLTFLKAGCLGFGGFMSLISVVENILVKKKQLLTSEEMLDGISLASLLPGPQAVNVVAYAGNKLKGTKGAIISAIAVIIPSFALMVALSYFYRIYGKNEIVQQLFKGFVPAVIAVIISVAWRMAQKNIKGVMEFVLMASAIAALILIPKEYRLYTTFLLVIMYGVIGYFAFFDRKSISAPQIDRGKFPITKLILTLVMVCILIAGLYLPLTVEHYKTLFNLTRTFAGLSVMLFGGGYVIIPIMQHHVVGVYHWLSPVAFKDGIAFSQIMPGPILIATAFIGFQVKGFWGALLSTIAIFTPPAVVMVVASNAMEYFKKSIAAKAVMRGIRCGVIGMIFFAAYELGKLAIPVPFVVLPSNYAELLSMYNTVANILPSLFIFAAALFVLIRYNVDVVFIIPTAGLIGYFLYPH